MIVAPAVDLKGGRCVQLVGGRPEDERVSLPDPVAQAVFWWEAGFGTLHVVDLDAALSQGHNRDVIETIVGETPATLQVGGGVRDEASLETLLGLGVHRVIVGTRAIDDPAWLEALAVKHPDRIVVAADVRNGTVVRKGWTESSGIPVLDLLKGLEPLPLAGILNTDVSREGRMAGMDTAAARTVVRGTRHPVGGSGGITTSGALRAMDEAGAAGAIVGMALYTNTLSIEATAREFGR